MTISKFLSGAFRKNTKCGGGIHPLLTLNLKKALELLINNPTSWGKGVGSGLVALQLLSTIEMGTGPFNFQLNEL